MVLLGDDMINLESQGISHLRELAVFVHPLRPIPNAPVYLCWHPHGFMLKSRRVSTLGVLSIAGSREGQPPG